MVSGTSAIEELQARIDELEKQLVEAQVERDSYRASSESLRRLIEQEMRRGVPCRICGHTGKHARTCYALSSTGYDLLNEHEDTLRENAELRQALAVHLPVNGHHIRVGGQYKSHRQRLREKLKRGAVRDGEGTPQ